MVSIIGDGAAWIRNLAAAAFPEATGIVDLYHACEAPAQPSPGPWSSCRAAARTSGSPPAWRTSTTATSTGSPPTLATARPQPGSEPESRRPHRRW